MRVKRFTFTAWRVLTWLQRQGASMSDSPLSELTTGNEADEKISLKNIIQGFLLNSNFLHEFRLQKLVYIADLVSKVKREDSQRLTNADFRPYMYGSYSEELGKTLNKLKEENELPHKRDRQYGKITTVYLGSQHPSMSPNEMQVQLQEGEKEIIEAVSQATKGWSNDELGEWSKDSWLYENTSYGEEMNFDRLDQAKHKVREELVQTFPSLESVLANQR